MGLYRLLAELHERVLEHLSSTRDLGRASCVCRAWRAGDSPVERVLRRRIKARGGAVSAALPPVAKYSMTHQLCLLDSISAAQAASGVMSLAYEASAAVDGHGRLCVWGRLDSSAEEAEDDESSAEEAEDDEASAGENTDPIFSFQEPTVMQTARVERVSFGGHHGYGHILALTDTGEVLSFGNGRNGKLGHGDAEDQREPKVIETLRGVRVVAIAAGCYHSMVLTDEGVVLSFGRGWYGMLGHSDWEDQHVPKVIEVLRGSTRVVAISAGDRHSMLLTDEGVVLSFGLGNWGRLGHGDCKTQLVPRVIEALRGTRVVAIAAGSAHSVVLTDEGAVLFFGSGVSGQLGRGDQIKPKAIEALRDVRVVAIAAGEHSMVLTDEGAVLSFGQGSHGYPLGYLRGRKLGDGEEEDQPVPKVIKALRGTRVVAIATCDRHSMVLTDEGTVLSLGYESNGPLGHGGKKNQCTPKLIAGLQAYRSLKQPAGSYPDKQPKPTGGSA